MARSKKPAALLILLLLFVSYAGAIDLSILISGSAEYGAYDLGFRDRVEPVQRVNLSIENQGSIGCEYRLRARYNTSGVNEAWSSPAALWPGGTEDLEMSFLVANYTGPVQTDLYLTFCGQQEKVANFTFEATGNTSLDTEIESSTLRANSSSATVRTGIEDGQLVPLETPPGWKVSSARVEDGMATVKYEAPLFQPSNVTYAVVSDGKVAGKTRVGLETRKTLLDVLISSVTEIVLAVSVLLNLGLLGLLIRQKRPEMLKALKWS